VLILTEMYRGTATVAAIMMGQGLVQLVYGFVQQSRSTQQVQPVGGGRLAVWQDSEPGLTYDATSLER
jgi:hypothetical protein